MNDSSHFITDPRGLRGEISVFVPDDCVVFGGTPPLWLDFSAFGLRPRRGGYWGREYYLSFRLERDALFLEAVGGRFGLLPPPILFGAKPERAQRRPDFWFWRPGVLWDYTGTLSVGRDFDARFWPENDYTHRVPCYPEVYKINGAVRLEHGHVEGK